MYSKVLYNIALFTLIVLSGCSGGTSGNNGNDSFGTGGTTEVPVVLQLQVLDQ
jgi:hypothetical protein